MKEYFIVNNEYIAPGAYLITLDAQMSFLPGQVVKISTDKHLAPRLYSICSGADEKHLQILYSIRPDGELTPKMSLLKPGDSVFVSEPFGEFVSDSLSACYIATGTGIAPFVSMLKSGNMHQKFLIHGARNKEGFYFAGFLESALGTKYMRCCSGNNTDAIFHGRVTKYLSEIQQLPSVQKYYLCGSAEMVVETRDILISRGVSYQHIFAEIYF